MPGDPVHASVPAALGEVALEKLVKVMGPVTGRRLFDDALAALSLRAVDTPEQLYAVGEHLSARQSMAGAVGGLICVAAVLRGATPRPR